MFDAKTAIQYIEKCFPQLASELHDDVIDGLLHPQIGAFSHYAQRVIDESNRNEWDTITSSFVEIYNDCSQDVLNAMNVSFLEHLNFKDEKHIRSWAYDTMPSVMKQAWIEMDAYNRKLHGG